MDTQRLRIAAIVSKDGNDPLHVGPTAEGLIPQPSIDRLREVGAWMDTNGEAIYGTSPWKVFRDGPPLSNSAAKVPKRNAGSSVDIRFTAKGKSLYAICLAWPDEGLALSAPLEKSGRYAFVYRIDFKEE